MPDDPEVLTAGSPPADGTSPADAGGEGSIDLGYTITTDAFSGPLDLLLFLVRRTEVDVIEIPLDTVIDQFVATVQAWQDMDLEVAGDFIAMAATLLEIKARLVAPPPEVEATALDDDNDLFDPRADLIRQLLAYRRFKEAAQVLGELEAAAFGRCPRRYREDIPDDPEDTPDLDLGEVDAHQLMRTCETIFARISGLGPRTVPLDDVPLTQRIAEVQDLLRAAKRSTLLDLMARETALPARLGLMLATLECTRQRYLEIRQIEQYGNVEVRWREDEERNRAPELPPEEPPPAGRRRRKPPLVTYCAPPRPDGEVDDAEMRDEDDGPQETDEQRFLREINEQCQVDRLLGVAQDVEKSFLELWYEQHPELRPAPPEAAPAVVPVAVIEPAPAPVVDAPVAKKPRPVRSAEKPAESPGPEALQPAAAVTTDVASAASTVTADTVSTTVVAAAPEAAAPAEPSPTTEPTSAGRPSEPAPSAVPPCETLAAPSVLAEAPAVIVPTAEAPLATDPPTPAQEATPCTETAPPQGDAVRTEAPPEPAVPVDLAPSARDAADAATGLNAEAAVQAEPVPPTAPDSAETPPTSDLRSEPAEPEAAPPVAGDTTDNPPLATVALSDPGTPATAPTDRADDAERTASPVHLPDAAARDQREPVRPAVPGNDDPEAELRRLLGDDEEDDEEDPEVELRRLLGEDDEEEDDSRRARHADLDEVNAALLADDTPLRRYVETAEDAGGPSATDYLAQLDTPVPARATTAPAPTADHADPAPDLPPATLEPVTPTAPEPVADETAIVTATPDVSTGTVANAVAPDVVAADPVTHPTDADTAADTIADTAAPSVLQTDAEPEIPQPAAPPDAPCADMPDPVPVTVPKPDAPDHADALLTGISVDSVDLGTPDVTPDATTPATRDEAGPQADPASPIDPDIAFLPPAVSAALTVDLDAPSDPARPVVRAPTTASAVLAATHLLLLPDDDSGDSGRLPTPSRDSAMLQAAARLRSGESGVLKSVSSRRSPVDDDETPSVGVPVLSDPTPATAHRAVVSAPPPDTAPPDAPPAPAADLPTPSETPSETDDDMAARAQLRIWRLTTAAAALATAALWWWTAVPRNVLEVVEAPPAVIDGGAPLAWRFNLDVLATDSDGSRLPPPRLTPACPGAWSWRDHRTLVFTPSVPMPAATVFTVHLPEDLRSAAGFRLHGATDTVLHTPALSLGGADVATLTPEGTVVALTFSHPVDPVRLATALSATQDGRTLDVAVLDQTPAATLRLRLPGSGPATLHLPAGFTGAVGSLGLEQAWTQDVILGHRLRAAAVSAVMPGRGPGLIRIAATGGSDLSVLAQAVHLDSPEPMRVVIRDGVLELIGDLPPGSERRVLIAARWPEADSKRPLTSYPAAGTFTVAIPHRQPTLWLGNDPTPGIIGLSGINTAPRTIDVLPATGDTALRTLPATAPASSEDTPWSARLDAGDLLHGLPGGRYRIRVRSADTDATIGVDKLVVPAERALAAWREWQDAQAVTPAAAESGLRICVVGER